MQHLCKQNKRDKLQICWLVAKRLKYWAFRDGCAFMWNGPEQRSTQAEISGDNGPLHLKKNPIKMPNHHVQVQVQCRYRRGHTGRRKRGMMFPPSHVAYFSFTVNNDKVALWCRRAAFYFLLTSKLWAFNPRWKCQALRMLPQLFFGVQCLGRLRQRKEM